MTISAKIIADSVSPDGKRITTMELLYPRFIHSEFMTHRCMSRNASSSRAIPIARMIADLKREPAWPIYWGSHQPGMQAGPELEGDALESVKAHWLQAMNLNILVAENMIKHGLHKQIANRILEPWAHIRVVVTSTEWDNFFELRAHKDAQPEIHELAIQMKAAMEASKPKYLKVGEWHLPYVTAMDELAAHDYIKSCHHENYPVSKTEVQLLLLQVSVARCARVSYFTHEGKPTTISDDIKLYAKLIVAKPAHASPCEHQATPDPKGVLNSDDTSKWGNFVGFIQHRKILGL